MNRVESVNVHIVKCVVSKDFWLSWLRNVVSFDMGNIFLRLYSSSLEIHLSLMKNRKDWWSKVCTYSESIYYVQNDTIMFCFIPEEILVSGEFKVILFKDNKNISRII